MDKRSKNSSKRDSEEELTEFHVSRDKNPRALIRRSLQALSPMAPEVVEEFVNVREDDAELIPQIYDHERASTASSNSSKGSKGDSSAGTGSRLGSRLTGRSLSRKLATVSSTNNYFANFEEFTMIRLFSSIGSGMDMELWWSRISKNQRITVLLLTILLFVAIAYLIAGLVFISTHLTKDTVPNPYVCTSKECISDGHRVAEYMDRDVKPCDNFYQFMCQKYDETNEEHGDYFEEFITKPVIKVELGEDSLLTKLLKSHRGKGSSSKSIKFYQSCLKMADGGIEFTMDPLKKRMDDWFGTDDFKTFDGRMSPTMDEIGGNLFKSVGHASYINMAFSNYPYILILEPHERATRYRFEKDPHNEAFLLKLFQGLMNYLGLEGSSSQPIIEDMVRGTHVMSTVIHELYSAAKVMKGALGRDDLTSPPPEIAKLFGSGGKMDGLCPPMGIKLDYFKVLELFIKEPFQVAYVSPTAHIFVYALRKCFHQDANKFDFTKYPIQHKRSAFAALWIADIFLHDYIQGMDYKYIAAEWGFQSIGEDHSFLAEIRKLSQSNVQFQCLVTMWTVLGSMPEASFLESEYPDPARWIEESKELAQRTYLEVRKLLHEIPETEIDSRMRFLADPLLHRRLHVDVGIHLDGGVFRKQVEDLDLGNDFLENILIGSAYMVEKSRLAWIGSTETSPDIEWYGSGGPGNIKNSLFLPQLVLIQSARFIEKDGAATNGEWEVFLGRPRVNTIRYPMTLFQGRENDPLALYTASISIPMIQAIMSLVSDADSKEKYPSLVPEDLVRNLAFDPQSANRSCSRLEVKLDTDDDARRHYYMEPSSVTEFTWGYDDLFFALLSVKMAFKRFQNERKYLDSLHFDHNLDEQSRYFITMRRLPAGLSEYTEEQLFFMEFTRNICRGTWKSEPTELDRQKHFLLETTLLSILMQMEEFSRVWNCPKKSLMNNRGEPRCFLWSP